MSLVTTSPDRSDDLALMDAPRREVTIGLMIAGAFFVLFLGWAALTPLDAGAFARGVIAVSGNRQAVQHREGGVVTALRVKEGDRVLRGQILAEISASELLARERSISSQVFALLAQRARLNAERAGAPQMETPPQFASLQGEDRVTAEEALRLQVLQFQSRRAALSAQKGLLNQRARELGEQITGYRRQLAANSRQQQLISDELAGVQALATRGYAPQTRVRALQRDAAGLQGTSGALQADISRSVESIGEARMQAISLERDFQADLAEQLRDAEVRLGQLQPELAAAREQVARAFVRAPATGKVVGMTVFTVGGVAQPGQTLMEVVPENKALVIQAMVSPNDADDLRPGARVQVRFPALHDRGLPLLDGALTRLSADSLEDEKTGQRYFSAEVSVPPEQLALIVRSNGAAALRPGLPVEVMVPLRKRTALDYLVEPLTDAFWRSFREH
jgi:HlyD family type I secretion membrane fusion protein